MPIVVNLDIMLARRKMSLIITIGAAYKRGMKLQEEQDLTV